MKSNGSVAQKESHGSARFLWTKPDMQDYGLQSLNVNLTFEEAMRLSVAIQSAIMALNRYDRRTDDGKRTGLYLSIKGDRIAVGETNLSKRRLVARDEG